MIYITSHFPLRQLKLASHPGMLPLHPAPWILSRPRPQTLPRAGISPSPSSSLLGARPGDPASIGALDRPLGRKQSRILLGPMSTIKGNKGLYVPIKQNSCKAFPSQHATCNKITTAHTRARVYPHTLQQVTYISPDLWGGVQIPPLTPIT